MNNNNNKQNNKIINDINILYINSNGFNELKSFIVFNKLIYEYNIIFIAETWFAEFKKIITHPNFVTTTPFPLIKKGSRYTNGIYCFAGNEIKKYIKVIETNDYSITINIFDIIIKAVYFQPTISRYKFEKGLKSKRSPNLVFGDFNINIYKNSEKEKEKLDTLTSYCHKNFLFKVPYTRKETTAKIPIWDHVFSKKELNIKLKISPPPFRSDHPSLEMTIELKRAINLNLTDSKIQDKIRYNLRNLLDPLIKHSFIQQMNLISPIVTNNIKDLELKFKSSPVSVKQEIVDTADELIIKLLQATCKQLLGTLNNNKKITQCASYSELINTDSYISYYSKIKDDNYKRNIADRLFKEHINNYSSNTQKIYPSTHLNEVDEVYNFYSSTYKPLSPEFYPYHLRDEYLGFENNHFYNYLSKEKLIFKIKHLPSNRACGSDGIYTAIIKNLIDIEFVVILTLSKLCISFCVTPLRWNHSIIYPILKGKYSKIFVDIRPIAITNIFRKLFETLRIHQE